MMNSSNWDSQVPILLEKLLHSSNFHTSLLKNKNLLTDEDTVKAQMIKTYYDRLYVQDHSFKNTDMYEIIQVNLNSALFIIQNLIFLLTQANKLITPAVLNKFELFSRIADHLQNTQYSLFKTYFPHSSHSFMTDTTPTQITIPDPYASLSSLSSLSSSWKVLCKKNQKPPRKIKLLWKKTHDEFFIKLMHPIIYRPILTFTRANVLNTIYPFEVIKFKRNTTYLYQIPQVFQNLLQSSPQNLQTFFFEVFLTFEKISPTNNDDILQNHESSLNPHIPSSIQEFSISIESYIDGVELLVDNDLTIHKYSPLYFFNSSLQYNKNYLFPSVMSNSSGYYTIHNVVYNNTLLKDTTSFIGTRHTT